MHVESFRIFKFLVCHVYDIIFHIFAEKELVEGICFINALLTLDLAHTINDCFKQCLKEHFILLLINLG